MAWLRALEHAARGWGLALAALGGDPAWCDDPEASVRWARSAMRTGVFSSWHVDLEAWAHPCWDIDRDPIVRGYLRCLDLLSAAVPDGLLEADVAAHLHEVRAEKGTLLEAVLRRTGRVTVLAYRTEVSGPDGISSLSAPTLAAAEVVGAQVRIAVDTTFQGSTPSDRRLTFHGQPARHLDTALSGVGRGASDSLAFAGVAVHDHAGWLALPDTARPVRPG